METSLAIGVMHAAFDAGLRVPEDISVIGFDNIHIAEFTFPPLTTIRMSCRDLTQGAVSVLCSRLQPNASETEAPSLTIPTELIVRRTTSIPKDTIQSLKPLSDISLQ